MPFRIANGAGFFGDQIDAPRRLVETAELDVLTLEYLAELTLSILARIRAKDPQAGYASDFLEVLQGLTPALASSPIRVVTNAGGMNPRSCAARAAQQLCQAGLSDMPIGVVHGDDILPQLSAWLNNGVSLDHLETGRPMSDVQDRLVSGNVYLGGAPIVAALDEDARIVICGRVADASLTVGPLVQHYGWAWDDWNRLAAASVAGHLIECGSQVTGGYSTSWADYRLADVGYPIAEVESDGSCVITKPAGSGGAVNRQTVVEQLVYEIGDPAHYLTPDVDVDFTTVEVSEQATDRVSVTGATGRPAPEHYKASLAYHDGYTASGQLLVYGPDCATKARAAAQIVLDRLDSAGCRPDRFHVELLGQGDGVPGQSVAATQPPELMLRISVSDPRREAVERFTKEIAPLITSGPAGLAGYASGGRSAVRPVLAYWPALVPRSLVQSSWEVRKASEWD